MRIVSLVVAFIIGIGVGYGINRWERQPAKLSPREVHTSPNIAVTPQKSIPTIDPIHAEIASMEWPRAMEYMIHNHVMERAYQERISADFLRDPNWAEKLSKMQGQVPNLGVFTNTVLQRIMSVGESNPEVAAQQLMQFLPNHPAVEPALEYVVNRWEDKYMVATFFEYAKEMARKYPESFGVDYLIDRWVVWGGDVWVPNGERCLRLARNTNLPAGHSKRVEVTGLSADMDLHEVAALEKSLAKLSDTMSSQELRGASDDWQDLRKQWDRAVRFYKTREQAKKILLPTPALTPENLRSIKEKLHALLG